MVTRHPVVGAERAPPVRGLRSPSSPSSPPDLTKPLPNPHGQNLANGNRDSAENPSPTNFASKTWEQMQSEWRSTADSPKNDVGGAAPNLSELAGGNSRQCDDGAPELTPKSSWESLPNESPDVKSPLRTASKASSPPIQTNNPFRQARPPSNSAPSNANYNEEGNANPWSDDSATAPEPLASSSLSKPGISNGDDLFSGGDAFSTKVPVSQNDPGQLRGLPSRHGLEELATSMDPTGTSSHGASSDLHMNRTNQSGIAYQNVTTSAPSDTCRQTSGPQPDSGTVPVPKTLDMDTAASKSLGSQAQSQEQAPPVPSKISENVDNYTVPARPPQPQTEPNPPTMNPQIRNETYQIRLVNWTDVKSPTSPRRSPIMMQNANGPCPLVALVNALVLTTPYDATTGLVEFLSLRPEVSLDRLLEAVFDELMSRRNGDLPDVGEFYEFLRDLHTGLNVNPCFIPSNEPVNLMDAPIDALSSAHDHRRAGGFEKTRQLMLYGVFRIPLIHGWIPPRTHPAFPALERQARTYDEAQIIQTQERELEEKLSRQGLTQEEQVVLEDIASIRYFTSSTATQLTGYGLDTISESLAPGALAILFRNDHFSTLYRHPQSGQLFTLVTDEGYAGHDEVVWESLVDVSGKDNGYYSGDFRPVGLISNESSQGNAPVGSGNGAGWTTVNGRSQRSRQSLQGRNPTVQEPLPAIENLGVSDNSHTHPSSTEQEDHDLALAMQLQEEEEEEHRQQNAQRQRRREDEMSEEYLNNADSQGRRTFPGFGRGARGAPTVPPRGGGRAGAGGGRGNDSSRPNASSRPPVQRPSSSDDPPPPSYEQAANRPAYHPPSDHPSYSPPAGPPPTQPRRHRGSSAYGEHQALSAFGGSPSTHSTPSYGPGPSSPRGRNSMPTSGRRKAGGMPVSSGADEAKREKDCVIM